LTSTSRAIGLHLAGADQDTDIGAEEKNHVIVGRNHYRAHTSVKVVKKSLKNARVKSGNRTS
jgi:hypothetical protein